MSKELSLEDYMKEDALLFDHLSKEICQKNSDKETNYTTLLESCQQFEDRVVLFNIVPSFYVMKTILYFKLDDYKNAHKYINGSLKYLLFVAKNGSVKSEKELKNFEEYKSTVIDQYKILTQKKPECTDNKSVILPSSAKFITTNDENIIKKELDIRFLMRKENISKMDAATKNGV